MIRKHWMIALVPLALALTTCNKEVGPEKVALAFYKALAEGDADAAYDWISIQDSSYKTREKFNDWMMSEGWPLERVEAIAKGADLLIRSTHESQTDGRVILEYSHPTFYRTYRELRRRRSTVAPDAFERQVRREIEERGYEPRRIAKNVKLKLEGGGWRVFLNFKEDEQYRLKLDEAIRLTEHGKLKQAQRALEEIARWREHFEDVELRLEEVQAALKSEKARQRYIDSHLKLEQMEVQTVSLGARRLFGYLVNTGPKTVMECGVGIYFYDEADRLLGEMIKFPVMRSKASSRYASPLKSGGRVRLNFSLDDGAPEGWKRISHKIVILELE